MTTKIGGMVVLFLLSSNAFAQQSKSLVQQCREMKYVLTAENFDRGWKDRVELEFKMVNAAKLASLRTALKDENLFVRSMAARVLGIRGDKASADALADLVENDPEDLVRIRAVESLGLLKMKPDVIDKATKHPHGGVKWAASLAAEQLKSRQDFQGQMLRAFSGGIQKEKMGVAKVGQPAPDFTALTIDGKPFKLSSVLGKKPIAIYFAAFDG